MILVVKALPAERVLGRWGPLGKSKDLCSRRQGGIGCQGGRASPLAGSACHSPTNPGLVQSSKHPFSTLKWPNRTWGKKRLPCRGRPWRYSSTRGPVWQPLLAASAWRRASGSPELGLKKGPKYSAEASRCHDARTATNGHQALPRGAASRRGHPPVSYQNLPGGRDDVDEPVGSGEDAGVALPGLDGLGIVHGQVRHLDRAHHDHLVMEVIYQLGIELDSPVDV